MLHVAGEDKRDGEMINEKCHRGDGIQAQEGEVAWVIFEKGAQADTFVVNLQVKR